MTQDGGFAYIDHACPGCKKPKGRPCTSAEACARLTMDPAPAKAAGPVGDLCPCGRDIHHLGRCWHRRGESAPPEVKPPAGKRLPRPVPTCEKCGRPRSHMSAHLCRNCYRGLDARPAMRKAERIPGSAPVKAAEPAPIAPPTSASAPAPAPVSSAPLMCACGRPDSHNGRCWARRAQSAANLVGRVEELERQMAALCKRLGIEVAE